VRKGEKGRKKVRGGGEKARGNEREELAVVYSRCCKSFYFSQSCLSGGEKRAKGRERERKSEKGRKKVRGGRGRRGRRGKDGGSWLWHCTVAAVSLFLFSNLAALEREERERKGERKRKGE
jgi:hypothetical protein